MGPNEEADPQSGQSSSSETNRASETAKLLFLAIAPLAFSCFYLWQVLQVTTPDRPLPMSPRSWPLIAAISLVTVSAGMTIAIASRRWRPVHDGEDEALDLRDVLVTVVVFVIYMSLLERIGFLLSSGLLVFVLSTLTSPTKWRRNAVVAVVFAVVAELLFDRVLGVHLPPGILTLPIE